MLNCSVESYGSCYMCRHAVAVSFDSLHSCYLKGFMFHTFFFHFNAKLMLSMENCTFGLLSWSL